MEFGFIQFNFDVFRSADFNSWQFSIIGMAVVFSGLFFIACYISLLPKMLKWASQLKQRALPKATPINIEYVAGEEDGLDTETLLAVATALYLHQFSSQENTSITWERHSLWDSSWQRAGRFEAMNLHGHLSPPRR